MALIDKLSAIGDAIREKNGTTDLMTLEQMPQAIADIQSGGGDAELENKLFTLEGDCSYKFYKGKWDWVVNEYSDRIKVGTITNLTRMFSASAVEEIPFDLNYYGTGYDGLASIFSDAESLKKVKYIFIQFKGSDPTGAMSDMFLNCNSLTEIPNDFFHRLLDLDGWNATNFARGSKKQMFKGCHSLKNVPDTSVIVSEVATTSNSFYQAAFTGCTVLKEIVGVPVCNKTTPLTSNAFSSTFTSCNRLKNIIFVTNNDGTPQVVSWKGQTIDLTYSTGHANSSYAFVGTDCDVVKDDATYQQYKDTENWGSVKPEYSRYNHDSAVETINSLPDTSAYLAENGGTNTIKFKGQSGELTDGGAINTLTEEEIAVATAKGWTVTLS